MDILQVLAESQQGQALATINERFREAIAAVLETQSKAVLTIKIGVEPRTQAMGGIVRTVDVKIETDVKRKHFQPGGAIFFVDAEGDLSRDVPDQATLFAAEEQEHK